MAMNDPLAHALSLVEQGERDPVLAVRNQRAIGELLRGAQGAPLAHHAARSSPSHGLDNPLHALGVTKIIRVEGVSALQPGATSNALPVEWPGGGGVVRSMFAGILDLNPALLSVVSVRIVMANNVELFTTGQSPAFVPLIAFQPGNLNWFRLSDIEASPLLKWTVYFKHEGLAGSPPISPFLLFGFLLKPANA